MQTEKYIYYLNRGGYVLEKKINEKFGCRLNGLSVKIRNPKGIKIAGDSSKFNDQQRDDFEIIRKKRSNIMDIMTYDDLIARIENVISFLQKKQVSI